MRKTLIAALSSAAIGAGAFAGATPAEANPLVVIPWLWVAGAGGLAVGVVAVSSAQQQQLQGRTSVAENVAPGGAATNSYGPASGPYGGAASSPSASGACEITRQPTANGGWRSVEVCG
jgi:hypothetical protein